MRPARTVLVPGFRGAGTACGIKKTGKTDLALVVSEHPCVSDVVFTRNRVFAAPVAWGKGLRSRSALRGVIVNSGNANACTGEEGLSAVRRTSDAVCAALGLPRNSLLVSSTGVIGVPLPASMIAAALPRLCASLSALGIAGAGDAMLTTDAYPKRGVRRISVRGRRVTLGGIAKGAGMIAPNMGTMLAYVFTDASVRPADLRRAFREAVDRTFNRIVVDGDTSTNDTAAIFANGACGLPPLAGRELAAFSEALQSLLLDLALMIVRDGEGATRVVRVAVTGAASDRDALRAARAVATSPLVKTAVFGADPNWGRVIAAVGRAGIRIDPARIELTFAGEKVLRRGMEIDHAAERRAAPKIRKEAYGIEVELGLGKGSSHLYFSDLNHEYIRINAGYRT
ncbi:MAG: bifunctional ornithine acetyltransferase/N-acetylglutamate synthase [Deltaproteobacteria bacterium RBG_16_64_85]|nr:MAG: bifunctional ornithine acetyltransferase/N-acetylglutamate synthase [Deltaproteobacteria bacterium RBG_16_64_85]